ncbi:hypothetical protein HPB49_009000 [Dermacentor silvarum]|uniref:Uncharacterized protein n=1 Tax=Dermacentor silvarum TaxID=543639 RepID=A0ACB8DC59_DERSI|nr:hypothetical protein HPB49_009000 [Dermacentor silvarum]
MDCEVEGEILTPEDFTKDSGWQLVAARRSTRRRNAAANQTGADVVEVQPNAGSNARCRPDHAGIKSKIIRGGRMPPLPKEEAKIIVRPRGGLCISKVGPTAVADAIWQAVGLDSVTRDTDTMCPNFQQNIMPGKHRLNADLAAAAPGPGRDPGLVDAPGAAPSPGPGRDPGSDTNLGPDPVPGAAKVPEPSHHPDLSPPPQAAGGNRPSFGPICRSVAVCNDEERQPRVLAPEERETRRVQNSESTEEISQLSNKQQSLQELLLSQNSYKVTPQHNWAASSNRAIDRKPCPAVEKCPDKMTCEPFMILVERIFLFWKFSHVYRDVEYEVFAPKRLVSIFPLHVPMSRRERKIETGIAGRAIAYSRWICRIRHYFKDRIGTCVVHLIRFVLPRTMSLDVTEVCADDDRPASVASFSHGRWFTVTGDH